MEIHFYLIREGDTDPSGATDPYSAPLTEAGIASVKRWATIAREWRLDMLCVSTLRAALDTGDLIEPGTVGVRWDLTELDDLALDDLNYDPRATHLVSTWTDEQMEQGLISLWTRLTAAYARILLYAETYNLHAVGIVASERVLNLLLLNWLGADWRQARHVRLSFAGSPVCRVTLADEKGATIEWLAPPPLPAEEST
ncbi:MAG: hypothetical protein GXX94_02595 [Chloroflexi bacterium]|nr:hypothetical protein [Chloroflexota bacterium]